MVAGGKSATWDSRENNPRLGFFASTDLTSRHQNNTILTSRKQEPAWVSGLRCDCHSFIANMFRHPILSVITSFCFLQLGASFVSRTALLFQARSIAPLLFQPVGQQRQRPLRLSSEFIITFEDDDDDKDDYDDDEEEDDDDEPEDPYQSIASSEFLDQNGNPRGGLVTATGQVATGMDWGGALSRLRERVDDVESGKSQDPSQALFRLMSGQSPNQAIGSFVQSANPQVVHAMSGAVSSLLGGLAGPQSGVDVIVKASGEKMGSLCFQLQMTGYLFRNAEYILALRDLLKLTGSATLQDYKDAFDRLDVDGSGYIEADEVRELLSDVYDGQTPEFEIDTFLRFFDQNKDGRISWDEYERGLGAALSQRVEGRGKINGQSRLLPGKADRDEDEAPEVQPEISGQIEVELEDGRKVKVEAKEYIQSLKDEARALKGALMKEKLGMEGSDADVSEFLAGGAPEGKSSDAFGSIATYIASRRGDVKSLTEGISPEIVDTMKLLVDYVLEGGESKKDKQFSSKEEITMEIPGSALQQLSLWQLILGYRLREAEAKGDYLKLLE